MTKPFYLNISVSLEFALKGKTDKSFFNPPPPHLSKRLLIINVYSLHLLHPQGSL